MIKNLNGGPNEPSQQQQIDISKTTPIKCEKCEGQTFKQTLLLRKLSAIVSPDGRETVVPVQVFACESCNNVNKEFTEMSGIQ